MVDAESSNSPLGRLVQGLQKDVSREYTAIIQYLIFSQKLSGAQYMEIAQVLEAHAHEELDHAIALARLLDGFGAYPVHASKTVIAPEDNEAMLWVRLHAEDEAIAAYHERVEQARALGEHEVAEILQGILRACYALFGR